LIAKEKCNAHTQKEDLTLLKVKRYNIIMNQEKLQEFNQELTDLLKKYEVTLTIEDVPASKRIGIAPIKTESEVTGTPVPNEPTE
jgi:hypothetical protein